MPHHVVPQVLFLTALAGLLSAKPAAWKPAFQERAVSQSVVTRHRPSHQPLRLTFHNVLAGVVKDSGSSVWEGWTNGSVRGRLRLELQQVESPFEAAKPVWHVRARWTVDGVSNARSFVAELEGMVDWKTGVTHLDGAITAGWMKGAWVQGEGQFVNGDMSGVLRIAPIAVVPTLPRQGQPDLGVNFDPNSIGPLPF